MIERLSEYRPKSRGVIVPRSFRYHAVTDRDLRTSPTNVSYDEDKYLFPADRRMLTATTRDAARNFALFSWVVRKHLDYVSGFTFTPQTDDAGLNDQLSRLMRWWSRRDQCDVARRHNLRRMVRLFEATRVISGDAGIIKIRGGQVQGVEGERVCRPNDPGQMDRDAMRRLSDHGLVVDPSTGEVLQYCVCRRDSGRMVFDRLVDARDMVWSGYYPLRFDSSRGVSPFAAALNTFVDLDETMEALRVKQKIHAMFGIAIKRAMETSLGDGFPHLDVDTGTDPTAATKRYNFELRNGLKLELEPGDDVVPIESRTPSEEARDYVELTIRVGMAALDIPYSFFDSRKSSYAAKRGDVVDYVKASRTKRDDLREVLDELTAWKVGQWVAAGMLALPGRMQARDVSWYWQSDGVPWIDLVAEVTAAERAIAAGLKTRQMVCNELGYDFFRDVLPGLAREEEAIVGAGVTIAIGQPGQQTTRDEETGNPANEPAAERVDEQPDGENDEDA